MLEKLLYFLASVWDTISPGKIVNQWEGGVILRFGIFERNATHGFCFKIPIIESIILTDVVSTTLSTPTQTLTTSCGCSVIIGSVIRYHIINPKKYLLDMYDATEVIMDTFQGSVNSIITKTEVNDLHNDKTEKRVLTLTRKNLKSYGIYAELVTFTDIGKVKSFRLILE